MQDIKIDFVTEFDDLPLLRGNISDLRLVFTNIIINAIEAFNHSGRIFIRTHYTAYKGYTVQVSDEGKGIDKGTLLHIFDPFFTTKGVEGNGLGLSQVYGLVIKMNGKINVESDVGRGTVMTIDLPDSLRVDPEESANKQAAEPVKVKKDKRIFIVEDESTIRELYRDMLGMQGYIVFTVESGEEGLQHWNDNSFDLIICDLGLPGMNGWEFIARIREHNSRIPIIALTGWGDMISNQEAADHQVQKVVSKPVQLSQFMDIIYELL
jgi:CheY-like chemotaxis protein